MIQNWRSRRQMLKVINISKKWFARKVRVSPFFSTNGYNISELQANVIMKVVEANFEMSEI